MSVEPTFSLVSQNGLRRVISIEAPQNLASAALDEELRTIQRKVTLRGFRKGRAPLAMIKSVYGAEARTEALEKLINESYPTAIERLNLRVAARPRITDITFDEGEPLRYTAEVDVLPEIETVTLEKLSYPRTEVTVTETDVEETLETMRRRASTFTDVTRPAAEADVLQTDILRLEDSKNAVDGHKLTDMPVDLSAPGTLTEFKAALIGAKAGETHRATVTYPADYPDATFAGSTVTYSLTVKSVRERHLPDLTDDFAMESAGVESLEKLREIIRARLTAQREEEGRRQRDTFLIDQVVKQNPIDIPEGMVEEYLEDVSKDLTKRYPGKAFETADLREAYREPGLAQLRWFLLSRRLLELNKIEVLPADTDKWIERMAAESGVDLSRARNMLSQGGRMREIQQRIIESKLMDFLAERATAV